MGEFRAYIALCAMKEARFRVPGNLGSSPIGEMQSCGFLMNSVPVLPEPCLLRTTLLTFSASEIPVNLDLHRKHGKHHYRSVNGSRVLRVILI